jgi:hypothetical protein
MSRREIRKTARNEFLPEKFEKAEKEQRFPGCEKTGGHDIARPMRAKINARPKNRRGDEPVEFPPAPIEKRAANGDDNVVVRMTRGKRGAGARAFFLGGNADARFFENGQQHGPGFFQFDQAHGFDLLRAWPRHNILERIDRQVSQTKDESGAKDKGAAAETAEDEERDRDGDKEWQPDISAADDGHEQVERGTRPLLVDGMKNRFVHSFPGQRENRSARRVKQAAVWFALLLGAALGHGQNFPSAQEVLANVRLRQSQQQIDLRGQLRQDAVIVPFHLVQEGPVVRYVFTDPSETLQLRLGANGSRLDDITRSGSTRISGGRLDDAVRATAITYEDLALRFLYWPNANVIGSDNIRTRNCWKMQLRAPPNDSQYGSILLWVDKDSGALMRMEGFDRAGKLIKRFEVISAQKIEGRWYLKQMRVEAIDAQTKRVRARTYLEIKS